MSFDEKLTWGQAGETHIARWLRSRGNNVLPIYEKVIDNGKGPRLFTPGEPLVAPDLFVYQTDGALWVESKRKSAFTWHRITGRWVTGIDLHHYSHYCQIDDMGPFPVWLLFLHEGGQAKDSPPDSPAGLFGNKLAILRQRENHRHDNWGKSGMVYWAHDSLLKLASIEDLQSL